MGNQAHFCTDIDRTISSHGAEWNCLGRSAFPCCTSTWHRHAWGAWKSGGAEGLIPSFLPFGEMSEAAETWCVWTNGNQVSRHLRLRHRFF